jgi:hypothetical protein
MSSAFSYFEEASSRESPCAQRPAIVQDQRPRSQRQAWFLLLQEFRLGGFESPGELIKKYMYIYRFLNLLRNSISGAWS